MVLLFTLLTLLVNSIHVGAQVYTTTLPVSTTLKNPGVIRWCI